MLHSTPEHCRWDFGCAPPPLDIFSVVCNTQELDMESSWRSTVEMPSCTTVVFAAAGVCMYLPGTSEY